jgi:hypothetical protein
VFYHNFLRNDSPPLVPKFLSHGKVYVDEARGVEYESVTTILGRHYKKGLARWRAKVGESEANRISKQAGGRGTAIHRLIERYLSNEPNYLEGGMPYEIHQMQQLRPILLDRVGEIYGIESKLCSDLLGTAGTMDLACKWQGVPSVVDFKTSLRPKEESQIESYFVQAATYGVMASARMGINIERIVVIIAVDHDQPQIFEKSILKYLDKVQKIFVNGNPHP